MRDIEYTYGVARVRANENSLLSVADIEQLISAQGYKDALRILADNGWKTPESSTDFSEMLEIESEKTWQLLIEVTPDIGELDALIIPNDFHNLKAALKATFSNETPSDFFIEPSVVSTDLINEAVGVMRFELLPEYMREPAGAAYDAIVRLENGRLADIILDVAALNTKIEMAKKSGSSLLLELSKFTGAVANIKAAVRCVRIRKDAEFISRAMCECEILDNGEMIEAALSGETELIHYITSTSLESGAEQLKSGAVAFEKWCDEAITEMVQNAKFTAFGPDPIIAYYIHRDAEIKNARIILSAKINNLSAEEIRKRVREVYV